VVPAICPAAPAGTSSAAPAGASVVGTGATGTGATGTGATGTATTAVSGSANHIEQIAAAQQQLSFWGVNQILQRRRDQLQATPVPPGASARIQAYAPEEDSALSYADQPQKNNPFGAIVTKAPPTAVADTTPVWGTWVQGLGDWQHDDPLSAGDFARSTATYAAQGGVDRTWQNLSAANDAFVLGLVATYANSNISYLSTMTTATLAGSGVGFYSEYVRGNFSTDLTTKVDFLNLNQNFGGAAPSTSIGIINAGVNGDVQYKFDLGHNNFVEPTAGAAFTHTMFQGGATALGLQNASTVRVQGGARGGTSWDLGNGFSVDASLRGLVYSDVLAQNANVNGGNVIGILIAPTDQGLIRGEFDPELAFNFPQAYSVTVSGSVRFGQALVGGSASVNLRKQF